MNNFKEHNNRLKAKQLAEYITGRELRQYLARKVKKYLGNEKITVFDGAVGSGQLEQFINLEKLYGVEIQKESYLTALENYPNADIECKSFFEYKRNDILCDCVIMNPPFSLKFKDLTGEEQKNIQTEFEWKKSGMLDDIFVLKSLKYTKRYAFHILFPGVAYRKTEQKFRELIGNNLLELNIIENAFEDTNISVLFIIIDKEKISPKITKERYDCKLKKTIKAEDGELNIEEDSRWEIVGTNIEEKEPINIEELQNDMDEMLVKFVENRLKLNIFLVKEIGENFDVLNTIKRIKAVCSEAEKEFKDYIKSNKEPEELQLELFNLFSKVGIDN